MAKPKYPRQQRGELEIVKFKEGSGSTSVVVSDGVDRVSFQFRDEERAFEENPDTGEPFFMLRVRSHFRKLAEQEDLKPSKKKLEKLKGKKFDPIEPKKKKKKKE